MATASTFNALFIFLATAGSHLSSAIVLHLESDASGSFSNQGLHSDDDNTVDNNIEDSTTGNTNNKTADINTDDNTTGNTEDNQTHPLALPWDNQTHPPALPWEKVRETSAAGARPDAARMRAQPYRMVTYMYLLNLIVWCLGGVLIGKRFEQPSPSDSESDNSPLALAKGKSVWIAFSLTLAVLNSYLSYSLTLYGCLFVNFLVESFGDHLAQFGGPVSKFADPGLHAVLAGQGVAGTVTWTVGLSFYMRYKGQVSISDGLLAYYSLRGCAAAVIVYVSMEVIEVPCSHSYFNWHGQAEITLIPTPGMEEHQEKMLVTLGVIHVVVPVLALIAHFVMMKLTIACCWFSASEDLRAGKGAFWNTLVESPRALMLAGFCVGAGYTVLMNVLYMPSFFMTELTTVEGQDGRDMARRLFIVAMRVAFACDPWLVAVSVGRVAKIAFDSPSGRPDLSRTDAMYCVAPAFLARVVQDETIFFVNQLGHDTMLILPFGFILSLWLFMDQWASFSDPSDV